MLKFGVDEGSSNRLIALLNGVPKLINRELKTAVNASAKITRASMNKTVRKSLQVNIKAVNKVLKIESVATEASLSSTVGIKKEGRIPLKEFGAKQNQKGVSYKISKEAGRKTVAGAFQGPSPKRIKISWRGNVFKRVGKARLPIVKLYGPSIWGAFVIGNHVAPTQIEATQELGKQVERRIRFLELKLAGKLRGNQK